jgi:hypothetical protein
MKTYQTPSVDLTSRELQQNALFAWTQFGFRIVLLMQCASDAARFRTISWGFQFDQYGFGLPGIGGFGKGVCWVRTRP